MSAQATALALGGKGGRTRRDRDPLSAGKNERGPDQIEKRRRREQRAEGDGRLTRLD
jgi:hypothetical protein